jgi:hypothetical protein
MQTKFLSAASALVEASAEFQAGNTLSVRFSSTREAALVTALNALADEHGFKLEAPLQLDSRGEFRLVAMRPQESPGWPSTSSFGAKFVERLNRHNPRTGAQAGAILCAENGWCFLNHFDAERLVLERLSELKASAVN